MALEEIQKGEILVENEALWREENGRAVRAEKAES
jgi:hypothetical protein